MKIREYQLGDMKITEYEPSKISCKEGGAHTIRHCYTKPSYCIHCKKTDDELFNQEPEHFSFSDNRNDITQVKTKRQNLDDFVED